MKDFIKNGGLTLVIFSIGVIVGIIMTAIAATPEAAKVHAFRNQAVNAGVVQWTITDDGWPVFAFINPCEGVTE